MLNAAAMPVRAIKTSTGIKLVMLSPYSRMQIPPAAERPNDNTKEMLIPVTLYQSPPKTAPTISAPADANALVNMFPGKNRSVKLN